ncbi:MAG: hypothetical protein ACTHJ4_05090 [Candidatus Nucleicultricaceae bacterium]
MMMKKILALLLFDVLLSAPLQAEIYEYTVPLEERDMSELPPGEIQTLTPFGVIVDGVLYKKGVKERQDNLKKAQQQRLAQVYFLEKSKIQFEGIAAHVLMNALKNSSHPSIVDLARKTLVASLAKLLKAAPNPEIAKSLKLYGDQVINQAILNLQTQLLTLKPQLLEQDLLKAVNRAISAVVLQPESIETVKSQLQKEVAQLQAKGMNPARINAQMTRALKSMDETYLAYLTQKDPSRAIQLIQSGKYNDYGASFVKTWLERAQTQHAKP